MLSGRALVKTGAMGHQSWGWRILSRNPTIGRILTFFTRSRLSRRRRLRFYDTMMSEAQSHGRSGQPYSLRSHYVHQTRRFPDEADPENSTKVTTYHSLHYRGSVDPVDWILPAYRTPPLRAMAVHAGVFRTCLSAGTRTDSTRHHGKTRLARSAGYSWLATLGLRLAARLPIHHVKKLHRAGRTFFLTAQAEPSNY